MQFKKKIFNFGQFLRFLWFLENHAHHPQFIRESVLHYAGMSHTPKLHYLFHHVKQYCLENHSGIGWVIEQVFERMHSAYRVGKNIEREEYANDLLKCVTAFNARRLC